MLTLQATSVGTATDKYDGQTPHCPLESSASTSQRDNSMSDKIWFFARGDTEHGPVTAKHIKALAQNGKLRGDDLVWREGMPDWSLAGEVSEIFSTTPHAIGESDDSFATPQTHELGTEPAASLSDAIPAASVPSNRPALSRKHKFLSLRDLGVSCIITGVLLVFLAKGCDLSHARYAASLQSRTDYALTTFENEWETKKIQLEQRQQALAQQAALDNNPLKRQQLQQVDDELKQWSSDKSSAQQQLQSGQWAQDRQTAADALASFYTLNFYRSLVFLLGAVVMLGGLSAVSLRGTGPERWICLAMLALAVCSLLISSDAFTSVPLPFATH